MTHSLAALLVPELRWDRDHGFEYLRESIDDAIELGVGGFLITGGPRDAVSSLTMELHRRSRHPLLIAADAECGAGQQFTGMTGLPPAAALGALHDAEVVRRAARLTARESRALGVNWLLAPVCDMDIDPRNPFLGSRAFSHDPQRVAEWAVEWIDTCQAEGVLACAKHFPGIGRAISDPHVAVSHVDETAGVLWDDDLLPFRAAVDTGVASIMAAHVVFPRLDASGAPASRSFPLLVELLRTELRYDGLIVSDSLSMAGARFGTDEPTAALESLQGGCDLLLAPADLVGVLEALDAARDDGRLDLDAVEASRSRRTFWANWGRSEHGREPTLDDVLWARQAADSVVHAVKGVIPNVGPVVDVILVEDVVEESAVALMARGAGVGTVATARGSDGAHLLETMRAVGLSPRLVAAPTAEAGGSVVVAVFGGAAPGRGRAGYSDATRRRVAQVMADARQAQRSAVVLMFGPPRLADALPEAQNVVCCWNGERAMQEAAARRLV